MAFVILLLGRIVVILHTTPQPVSQLKSMAESTRLRAPAPG